MLNAVHRPFACTRAAHIDVRIIGVTHEAMTATLKLSIKFVEQDIRQQRRERAALRRPLLPLVDDPARHDPGFEVATDQFEHTLVFNVTLHARHQSVVVDSIKELLKIDLHAPAMARHHMGTCHFNGLVSASARTEAVAEIRKQWVEDRCELLQQGLLDEAINDTRDTQLSCSACGLGISTARTAWGWYSPANNLALRMGQYCFT
ncbi:hypothetical protein A0O30_05890 [Pseudomonas sp. LLC-1]|nr:hypothetical protein A0O30_05890 [Pseudomonas sp. LLC-1]